MLSTSSFDDKIAWYENGEDQEFTAHTITTVADGAQSVVAADVDGDGDLDVLSASYIDNKIGWYENRNAIAPSADPGGPYVANAGDVIALDRFDPIHRGR